ncbi:hypothetical protein [Methylobacterium thuringiense]|uniref:Uncharacterized protein n=1 Tax=Methylobacterium thuringiense TaxID=1003091 RepID=A0ABQ4TJA1_9HYPH|nr:hypothetical protein [Methylobacterium thuringiense]GJE54602.1 hypothetical protein EKPJFOCH_1080 [Methylobacterium thuringiense]
MAGSADARVYLRKTDQNGAVTETFSPPDQLIAAAPIAVRGVIAPTATHLANRAVASHTAVANTNYTVLASDVHVGFASLTASRVVTLCDVDTYPLGQDLVIGDETGACSDAIRITVQIGGGTGDSIPQQSDGIIVLAYPYASVRLRRGAANIWLIV